MNVTRFAPSPTGYLHLGHAYAAMVAAESGDRFLLRLEDIDRARCKPEYEAAIYEDLGWLGLDWENPVLRQSRARSGLRRRAQQIGCRRLDLSLLLHP